jgi:hypothetical protein
MKLLIQINRNNEMGATCGCTEKEENESNEISVD